MDGPYPPGYHAHVTGRRADDERPGERRGPVALYAEVCLYGPQRWWVRGPLTLLFPAQDVETVWRSTEVPVQWPDDSLSGRWSTVSQQLLAEAEAVASAFTKGIR